MDKSLIIFLVGTTAVGKTRLSIQLAKIFGGQIVSCDSKQLYRHANILTAKATPQQISMAHHYMIDCLQLNQSTYNRNKYYGEATKCINQISKKGKIPIVVGGTNYYIQTLLYDMQIKTFMEETKEKRDTQDKVEQSEKDQQNDQPQKSVSNKKLEEFKKMNPQQKYKLLQQVDSKMAQKLHPNDQLRVNNALQKYYLTGIVPSTIYQPYTHNLRNPNTILFWLRNSNKIQHRNNIAKRINNMLTKGQDGIIEILSVFSYLKNNNISDCGIAQTIGYKQFQQFYKTFKFEIGIQYKKFEDIEKEIRKIYKQLQINKQVLEKCKNLLINNTAQYSKRQLTWIRNRIFSGQNRNHFFILQLEGEGDLEQRFINNIQKPSIQIVKRIMSDGFGSIQEKEQQFKIKQYDSFNDWKKTKCQTCKIQANGALQWEIHLTSRKHLRNQKIKFKYHQKRQQQQKQKKSQYSKKTIKQQKLQKQEIQQKQQKEQEQQKEQKEKKQIQRKQQE